MASLVVWWHASQYTMRYLHMWMDVLNVVECIGGVFGSWIERDGMGWDVGSEVGGEMMWLCSVLWARFRKLDSGGIVLYV